MTKTINDSLYGRIELADIAVRIIDTPEFQRLRYIHQLGVCYLVFPNATHTRFEHSIGVYHLAGELLHRIKIANPELQILEHEIELCKIAGLVHDLGHGAFSHLLDNIFDNLDNDINTNDFKVSLCHETRSCDIFKMICHKYKLFNVLSEHDIQTICNYIIPPEHLPPDTPNQFMYSIIANKKSDLDVDKMDYIARDTHALSRPDGVDYKLIIHGVKVVDNEITYPSKVGYDIQQLFMTRYRLHKQIYNHHAVIGTEILVQKILELYSDHDRPCFCDFFRSYDDFILLTDDVLPYLYRNGCAQAKSYANILQTRKGYKLIASFDHTEQIVFPHGINQSNIEQKKYRFALCGKDHNPIEKILFRWPDGSVKEEKAEKFSPLTGLVNVEKGIRLYYLE